MQLGATSILDKLSIGSITTVLGLGMTFLVLITLIGCIFLIKLAIKKLSILFADIKQNKKSKKVEESSINNSTSSTDNNYDIDADNLVDEKVTKIDDNTLTAIQDAVALFSQQDDKDKKPHNNIIIKSIVEID